MRSVGSIRPTLAVADIPLPTANAGPDGVAVGSDGNIWFTENGGSAIGFVALPPATATTLAVTTEPPSAVSVGSVFGLTVTAEDGSGDRCPPSPAA